MEFEPFPVPYDLLKARQLYKAYKRFDDAKVV